MNTHAVFTCKNHPLKRWHAKWEAVSSNGRYTGARHIFYNLMGDSDDDFECTCPASDLMLVEGQTRPDGHEG